MLPTQRTDTLNGYHGRILRVDLSKGQAIGESIDASVLRKYVGGTALGIKLLYDTVPPSVEWSSPENLLFLGSGPLGGTSVGGSGTICGVTKGALTNGVACSQANGHFGAYLRFSGYDAIAILGMSNDFVYLHIHEDGSVEIKDASHLRGKDTFETEDLIKAENDRKEHEMSVLSIGPAGENLIKYSAICTGKGHFLAHNGFGTVMGSKKLKAIAVNRGKRNLPLKDKKGLAEVANKIREYALGEGNYERVSKFGTLFYYKLIHEMGGTPVKNLTTSIFNISEEQLQNYYPENIKKNFEEIKKRPCWSCQYDHCNRIKIPTGKHAGREVEEPEYEGLAAWSSQVGITDVVATVVLSDLVDRLGMDTNESGWVIGWVLECYEKGILTNEDTDGLEMDWGNADAIEEMLYKIVNREGIGDILAEGVMRASEHVGRGSEKMAVSNMKGGTPRSHDHRVFTGWLELFDTCVSNTGTLESQFSAPYRILGIRPHEWYNPQEVSLVEAKIKGAMMFEDCLGTCRFNTATNVELLPEAVNKATGWDMSKEEAMLIGLRSVNMARAYNIRCGIIGDLDKPSLRYGSTAIDGPVAGQNVMSHWKDMLQDYYRFMGWDESGVPLPETLTHLGLENIISDLRSD